MPALLLYLLQLLLLLLTFQCTHDFPLCNAVALVLITEHPANCIENERMALLDFKKNIIDPNNNLYSWAGQDCCSWKGVNCDNQTGNIDRLELGWQISDQQYFNLRGEISLSLLHLQHLKHLDLSGNFFLGESIPSFLSQFKELRYLNLSGSYFAGHIPASFGNLSSLHTLDLSYNYGVHVDDPTHQWLSHLTSLQHLVVSGVTFGSNSSSSLFLALNKLPSIKEIRLSECELESVSLFIPHLNFSSLFILDISYNYINFSVSSLLFNLKSLQYLYLSNNHFNNIEHHYQWLSHLTSLQHFDMSYNTISNSSRTLFLALNKLPSIKEIHLTRCEFKSIPVSFPQLNFSSLSLLDLSYNNINFSGISWMFNLKSLQYLDLGHNELYPDSLFSPPDDHPFRQILIPAENIKQTNEISIPESIGSLCSLKTLDLSGLNINMTLIELGHVFSGCLMNSLAHLHLASVNLKGDIIAGWIWDIKNLKSLDLSDNSLSGSVPLSLAKLAQLEYMNLANNQLRGAISEAHFTQLEKLETLDISHNSLVFNVSSNWAPPFLLKEMRISSCSVGPKFPAWLQTQHKLHALDMSQTGISDTMPDWFWNLTSRHIVHLDVSNNQIQGIIPKSLHFINLEWIDLSSNRFYGPLPKIPGSRVMSINLSNNSFSGFIPHNIIDDSHQSYLQILLSMNKLNGTIPSSFCQIRRLILLDISTNQLSGELPDCWLNSSILTDLNVADNNLSGTIPNSLCYVPYLQSLQLSHNKLSGEFPVSLKNCSKLPGLDLSHNNFSGRIPNWVGENLSSLSVLILKSNSFTDHIPQEISQLKYLQILDLSNNNVSGPIPKSLGNLTTMQMTPKNTYWLPVFLAGPQSMLLNLNQREDEYKSNRLPYIKYIDLSNNNLSENIPEELASLYGLQSLNLSGNTLEGEIPDKLGRMQQLESLDLSRNKFLGNIPATLSNLTFLSLFNVSHNNLSGRIPSGNQFNTFRDPFIYIGNHLCGFPLSDNCTKEAVTSKEGPNDDKAEMDEDDDDILWLYIGSLTGFPVGSSIVWKGKEKLLAKQLREEFSSWSQM
ncbi:receptor-like protein EIX2 [Dioscorea cayenensis subsp. rotundata]|uniref:Receptor-like protein EIX2 n=1 Tax=Dioscorea cayennensis subsp. rotundata TaxID=55577 RepID=A0AB40C600_DIOCR|nr:receptor-like protein EIX2 [Dioscorea cayenensis subsp. rotundata]